MATEKDSIVYDFSFLLEASKKLHGYLLHTWFKLYLEVLAGNMNRWIKYGLIGQDCQPVEGGRYLLLFDRDSLNIEKITYVIGFYVFILSSHKKSNRILMHEDGTKRVLYLRGFDYESAVYAGDRLGVGYSSLDTMQFSHELAGKLHPDFEIFTVLSPRDLFWYTAGTQQYFYGDHDGLIQLACGYPLRSVYLNANYWQADVSELVDRVDHFVVYVSSITESVLWELDLLKQKRRTGDATVVFDEKAIANKEKMVGLQERMKETHGDKVLWSKSRPEARLPASEQLRDVLAQDFLVVTPKEFFRNLKWHKTRISKASGPLGLGSREEPLPFRFFPAQDADELKRIYDFDESVETFIREQMSSKSIKSLPLFLNNVQLKIYTSLMLGKHDETGRALAVYAAVLDVTRKRLFETQTPVDDAAADRDARTSELLEEHFAMARYSSHMLMAFGKSDEFGNYTEKAHEVYEEVFASAAEAVESFFSEVRRRGRG